MAKVSICIPAYNNEQSVRRLLESIERQKFKDYEVVITDDSDGEGIRKLAEEKGYIKYYKNKTALGAAANWNAAIGKSSGEYVKIMHHDDWFTDADSLQNFVDMLEQHPEAGMAFSGSRQEEEGRSYERFIAAEDAALIERDYRNLFLGNTIGAPSGTIVRRSVLENPVQENGQGDKSKKEGIAYDKNLTWLVDMDYYMNILKHNSRFVYTEKPLVSIGISKEQLTETCKDDKALHAFEYGYVYQKYQLGDCGECRRKLIRLLADAGKSREEAHTYGITEKEYTEEKRRKLLSKCRWKLMHLADKESIFLLLLLVFIFSLLPILGLSAVNHATGDDLGYGIYTHAAWRDTHSLWEVMKASGKTIRQYYYGWQGTWLSVFFFSLQPEVFSPKAYVIVPFLMLGLWLGSTWILSRYLLVKKAGFSRACFGSLYLLFAMAGIQFVPSTRSAIFWYNGTAHYIIPYAIALTGIYFYLKFIDGEKKKRSYICLSLCMAMLGGVNYQAALMAPVIMVLLALCQWKNKEKRTRAVYCIFPLLLEMAGLIVSMTAPGNKVRGGEEFGFSLSAAVGTVLSCFVRGIVQAVEYIKEHPLLLLLFAAAAVIVWYSAKEEGEKGKYPLPGLFAVLSYCVYCAVFAPEIYAGVEVSGGVYNMNYYMFLFMVFSDIIYITGAVQQQVHWLSRWKNKRALSGDSASETVRAEETERREKRETVFFFGSAVLAVLFLFLFKGDIKTTATYQSIEYIKSGQAADYKAQMEYQLSVLLDDNVKDVVLPALNDNQGPLMHMPITDNPDGWTNINTKMFYNKDSVVSVSKEVWDEIQGMD